MNPRIPVPVWLRPVDPAHELTERLHTAAVYVAEHGWVQGTKQDDTGRVCLTGAVKLCAPQTGDEYLILQVLRRSDHAETWNDEGGRTEEEVRGYLASTEITDADLAGTYGPQWEPMVALVRRIASLTAEEHDRLAASRAASWAASRAASRAASWAASWDASWAASRAASRSASWDASRAASWDASWDAWAAWDASLAASRALHIRDLIGGAFTAKHYKTLTRPWVEVIGPVHPDDERDGLLAEVPR